MTWLSKRSGCGISRNRNESKRNSKNANRSLNQEWKQTVRAAMDTRGVRAQKVDEKGFRALQTNERIYRAKLGRRKANTPAASRNCGRRRTRKPDNSPTLTRRKWRD